MDAAGALGVIAALGVLAGVSVAAVLVVRRSRRGTIPGLSRSASRRVADRVREIAADHGDVAVIAGIQQPFVPVPLGPRRRLWRDTSAALTALGALVIVVMIVDPTRPGGAVLDVTGAPGSSRPVIAFASPSLHRPATAGWAASAATTATPSPRMSPPQRDAATPTAAAVPSQPASTTRPRDTSDRMAVVTPCPGRRDCYVYLVRRGDNLRSIANWFGIPYPTVLRLNPRIADPRYVHAGDRIRLPTPAR